MAPGAGQQGRPGLALLARSGEGFPEGGGNLVPPMGPVIEQLGSESEPPSEPGVGIRLAIQALGHFPDGADRAERYARLAAGREPSGDIGPGGFGPAGEPL